MQGEIVILFLSPSLNAQGGVSEYCKTLLNYLDHPFKLTCLTIGNRPSNNILAKRIFYPLKDSLSLVRTLVLEQCDVIHLNSSLKRYALLRDSFYLMIVTLMGYGGRTMFHVHGWDKDLFEKVLKSIIFKRIFCWLLSRTGIVLVLSNNFKKQLQQLGIPSEKICVTTTMYCQLPSSIMQHNYGKVHVLFMSRFVRDKGLYIAAKVARLLRDSGNSNWLFTFAGDGIEMEGLKAYLLKHRLEDIVNLTGYVVGKEKEKLLFLSDILLFPTHYGEGCPVTILEAMGSGQVIISTPVGGIPEIVEDGVNGFLHDSDDPLIFFNSVKRLMEDRELLIKMQKRNRRKAENNYEASIVAKKIKRLYLEVINGGI